MPRMSLPRAAVAVLAFVASGELLAQPVPTLVIDFSPPRNVPLDLRSTVAAALLIGSAAYAYFRRRDAGRYGRLTAGIAVVAVAAGAILASRVDFVATAEANILPVLNLTQSPASIAINGNGLFEVHNSAGAGIVINGVTIQNPVQGQQIVEVRGLNCAPGLFLPVNGSCFVGVGSVPD